MLDVLESFDGLAGLRNGLRRLSEERGEWAGYPLPLEDLPLRIEPTWPRADALMDLYRKPSSEEDAAFMADVRIRNTFWSVRYRSNVTVWEKAGKVEWGLTSPANRAAMEIATLGAADAWGIEQESAAVNTLGTLLRHRQFKQYLMTGSFLERSPRSGISYLFRRLRPTLAISHREGYMKAGNGSRILAALCLHPIGYYEGSWAGAMCPTDDILAHLMLMRGDEAMFWRRANQHPPHRQEAAI